MTSTSLTTTTLSCISRSY